MHLIPSLLAVATVVGALGVYRIPEGDNFELNFGHKVWKYERNLTRGRGVADHQEIWYCLHAEERLRHKKKCRRWHDKYGREDTEGRVWIDGGSGTLIIPNITRSQEGEYYTYEIGTRDTVTPRSSIYVKVLPGQLQPPRT